MKVLQTNLKLNTSYNQVNIKFPFTLEEDYEKLIIKFNYSPRLVDKEIAYPKIIKTIQRDIPKTSKNYQEMMDNANNMSLENLITVSLSLNNNFIGSWHNKSNDQTCIISKDYVTYGFIKTQIVKGNYEVQLNPHHIWCDIEGSISVEVE